MRKLDLSPHLVMVRKPDGETAEIPYEFRGSLATILFLPELGLSAREVLQRQLLAAKIENCQDYSILLEESDYAKLLAALDAAKGFNRNDAEFIRRVIEAPEVQVQEK